MEDNSRQVDLLLTGGTVITMNADHSVIEDGAVAIVGNRIAAVGSTSEIAGSVDAKRTIDASGRVIMPGLIDCYAHAGHGMIKGIFRPALGWPANPIYWHATTPDWWYAEAMLSGLERVRFGTTTGVSILGATPARADNPVYADRHLEALRELGTRAVLGVGPPDPFIPHIPVPWSGSHFENGQWVGRSFSYAQAIENSTDVIQRWHGSSDGRISIALAISYLFGRRAVHERFPYSYDEQNDPPVILENAREARQLADQLGIQIHTHVFRGDLDFAEERFGRRTVLEILGSDVVLDHANSLATPEIDLIATAGAHVVAVAFVGETVNYGACPVIDLLEAGANVAIATDGSAPYFSLDLWKELTRTMFVHRIEHNDMAILPPGKALRMVTIDAARALNMEDEIGSLEVGKKADIILVDLRSPHLTPRASIPSLLAYYATGSDVETTIVDGRILMENRRVVTVDEQAMLEFAMEEQLRAEARYDVSRYTGMDEIFWTAPRDIPGPAG